MSALFLASRLLPVPHGFSTRYGGVSQGDYATLNLGMVEGERTANVEENLSRLAKAGTFALERLRTVSQVHADRVIQVSGREEGDPRGAGEADALWTSTPEVVVGIRTADCIPILLVDLEGRRVAAVHSGWRGTEARIAARAVEALVAQGAEPTRLLAAIGPSIRACCYEVSADLAERFQQGFGAAVVEQRGASAHLDLAGAVRLTLQSAGLTLNHIDDLELCTACESERFFSHRRDRGHSGRHLSFAVCRFPDIAVAASKRPVS